jgi:hypothetical protein
MQISRKKDIKSTRRELRFVIFSEQEILWLLREVSEKLGEQLIPIALCLRKTPLKTMRM